MSCRRSSRAPSLATCSSRKYEPHNLTGPSSVYTFPDQNSNSLVNFPRTRRFAIKSQTLRTNRSGLDGLDAGLRAQVSERPGVEVARERRVRSFQIESNTATMLGVQGYLVHKNPPPPLGPPWDHRHRSTVGSLGGTFSNERSTPVFTAARALLFKGPGVGHWG